MKSYTNLGLDEQLRAKSGVASEPREWQSEFSQDVNVEKGPYSNPTLINKGTVTITGGGVLTVKDSTGGTTLLTINPTTGEVTVAGTLTITQTLSGGTINTARIIGGTAGTVQVIGGTVGTSMLAGGTLGTATLAGGTVNPASYKINGTSSYTGTQTFDDLGTITHTVGINQGIITSWATA